MGLDFAAGQHGKDRLASRIAQSAPRSGVAKEAGDQQAPSAICTGEVRGDQHQQKIDWGAVDRIEINGLLEVGENAEDPAAALQFAVRDGDARPDPGGAKGLTLQNGIEVSSAGRPEICPAASLTPCRAAFFEDTLSEGRMASAAIRSVNPIGKFKSPLTRPHSCKPVTVRSASFPLSCSRTSIRLSAHLPDAASNSHAESDTVSRVSRIDPADMSVGASINDVNVPVSGVAEHQDRST